MRWLRFVCSLPVQSAACFCDACATVTHCDVSHRMEAIRKDALTRSVYLRPL
jgi:hypothetical protein